MANIYQIRQRALNAGASSNEELLVLGAFLVYQENIEQEYSPEFTSKWLVGYRKQLNRKMLK